MKDSHLTPPDEPAGPTEIIRRRMVEEALVSEQLRSAIEVALRRFRGRSYRWNELLADAEEIRNEVALRALNHLGSFDHREARPLPWLMGIAVNVLRERAVWFAKDSSHAVRQSSCSEEEWADVLSKLSVQPRPTDEPSPVWQALARLDAEQQRTLRLRFVEDSPYAELARKFGISEQTARARVCRALQALRRQFSSENTVEPRRDGP